MKKTLSAIAFMAFLGVSSFNQNAMADLGEVLGAFEVEETASKKRSISIEFEDQTREHLPKIFSVLFSRGSIQEDNYAGRTLNGMAGVSLGEDTVFAYRCPCIRVSGFKVCSAKTKFDRASIYTLCVSINLSRLRSTEDIFFVDEFNLSVKGTEIEASSKEFYIERRELTGAANVAICEAFGSIGSDQLVLETEFMLIPLRKEKCDLRSDSATSAIEAEQEISSQTRQALKEALTHNTLLAKENSKLLEENRELQEEIRKHLEASTDSREKIEELKRKYASLNAHFEQTMSDKLVAQKKAYDAEALVEGLKQEAKIIRQYMKDLETEAVHLRQTIKELKGSQIG